MNTERSKDARQYVQARRRVRNTKTLDCFSEASLRLRHTVDEVRV